MSEAWNIKILGNDDGQIELDYQTIRIILENCGFNLLGFQFGSGVDVFFSEKVELQKHFSKKKYEIKQLGTTHQRNATFVSIERYQQITSNLSEVKKGEEWIIEVFLLFTIL